MMHIRKAGVLDCRALADLLNEIIAKGGTTALVNPVSTETIAEWMGTENSCWHLAEDDNGNVLGYQWFDPHPDLPKDAAHIATFVKLGKTGLGIGSSLFEATKKVAPKMGYNHIDAVIRTDNTGGLAYYQSRGFEHFRDLPNMKLANGTTVDKVWTRYSFR